MTPSVLVRALSSTLRFADLGLEAISPTPLTTKGGWGGVKWGVCALARRRAVLTAMFASLLLPFSLSFSSVALAHRSTVDDGAAVRVSSTGSSGARLKTGSVPITVADSYITPKDQTLGVTGPGELQNDSDPEGDFLVAKPGSPDVQPQHGALSRFSQEGGFIYVPDPGYVETDWFIYRAFGGTSYSANATVTNNGAAPNTAAPIAVGDSYSAGEGEVLTVFGNMGVLRNDSDPEGASLLAAIGNPNVQPQHGTLSLWSDGGFQYTPNDAFVGTDTFTYQAFDGQFFSANATVTINVTSASDPNEPPQVSDQEFFVEWENSEVGSVVGQILAADDGLPAIPGALQYSSRSLGPFPFEVLPETGEIVIKEPLEPGDVITFSVDVTDGALASTASIKVSMWSVQSTCQFSGGDYDGDGVCDDVDTDDDGDGLDDPVDPCPLDPVDSCVSEQKPVANDLAVTTTQNVAVATSLLASDPNGDELTYIVGAPGHGMLSGTAPALVYTPNAGYTGDDAFFYQVSDGEFKSNQALVSIRINPANCSADGGDTDGDGVCNDTDSDDDGDGLNDSVDPCPLDHLNQCDADFGWDYSVDITTEDLVVLSGAEIGYEITVENIGLVDHARNEYVLLEISLPVGSVYQGQVAQAGWSCAELSGNLLTCERFDGLAVGEKSILSVGVLGPLSAGMAMANVVVNVPKDSSLSNNSDQAQTSVALPDCSAAGGNTDGDGLCNDADPDDDNDGLADPQDPCPMDPLNQCVPPPDCSAAGGDTDGDGICNDADPDDDNDGLADPQDPCPTDPLNQCVPPPDCSTAGGDTDGDGICNDADPDDDNDGLADPLDPCPTDPLNQCVAPPDCSTAGGDTDGDGICNDTDPDDDNDGLADPLDPCPSDPLNQCVPPPDCSAAGNDTDGDGICNDTDPDDDNDGLADPLDPCPTDPLNQCVPPPNCLIEGGDTDGDGICNDTDPDDDNDGLTDPQDPCPTDPFNQCVPPPDCSTAGGDTDGDGICNDIDTDDDNDGLTDPQDPCPTDPLNQCVPPPDCAAAGGDSDGDGICNDTDPDDDNDGLTDPLDPCPTDPLNQCAPPPNCSAEGGDTDGDGICNDADPDDDNDGLIDRLDPCPVDPLNQCAGGRIFKDGFEN